MNWEAVGAIAELTGVIGIFVSLIYLAVQIRQNTQQSSLNVEANQLAAFERNIDSANRIRELLVLHPELAELLSRGYKSYKGLEAIEQFRFGLLLRNIFAATQGAYIRQLALKHAPDEFAGPAHIVDEILTNRGAREWLEDNEPDWRPTFRAFVDERLEAIKRNASGPPE
ncbi:MAG: hypothetical protein OEW68_17760 [Gammaproteobacteria bacterium]|nr:hypothetical protein [Gammaproteobacteria bacterium]MDH4316663.1 hypothetical protein [Gammaproteobacteria bacterium]